MDKWSFNIFKVAEFSNNRPLSCIMYAIFQVKPPELLLVPRLLPSPKLWLLLRRESC